MGPLCRLHGTNSTVRRLSTALWHWRVQPQAARGTLSKAGQAFLAGRLFTALLLRRKYAKCQWRFALVYERLRCEPWRPINAQPRAEWDDREVA